MSVSRSEARQLVYQVLPSGPEDPPGLRTGLRTDPCLSRCENAFQFLGPFDGFPMLLAMESFAAGWERLGMNKDPRSERTRASDLAGVMLLKTDVEVPAGSLVEPAVCLRPKHVGAKHEMMLQKTGGANQN